MKTNEGTRTMSELIVELDGGQLDDNASVALREAVRRVAARATMTDTVKGANATVTVSVEIKAINQAGKVSITGSVTSKLPKPPKVAEAYYAGDDGELNVSQLRLPTEITIQQPLQNPNGTR